MNVSTVDALGDRAGAGRLAKPMPAAGGRSATLLAGGVLLLSALAQYPIVHNYFTEDDFLHLFQVVNFGLGRFLVTIHGSHLYILRNFIFYVCFKLFGPYPTPYFILVFVNHLANVLLLFGVVRVFTGSSYLAALGGVLWGASLQDRGVLGWYSAHGQVLLTTILLWVLYDTARVARGEVALRPSRWLSWYVLLLAGSTCFGSGIGVALVFPAVLLLLLPQERDRRRLSLVFVSLLIAVPLLYVSCQRLYSFVLSHPGLQAGEWRIGVSGHAQVTQNNLSILIRHLDDVVLIGSVLAGLMREGVAALVLGAVSADQLTATRVYLATGAVGVMCLVAAVRGSVAKRKRMLALVVLLLAVYGMIAAGRAFATVAFGLTVESLAGTARYHYLGPALACILLCIAVQCIGELGTVLRWCGTTVIVLWLAATTYAALRGRMALPRYDEARNETAGVLRSIDAEVRRQQGSGPVYISNERFLSAGWGGGNPASFPGSAAIFEIFYPEDTVNGARVYFIEPDPQIVAAAAAEKGTRIASLIVAPEHAPGVPTR